MGECFDFPGSSAAKVASNPFGQRSSNRKSPGNSIVVIDLLELPYSRFPSSKKRNTSFFISTSPRLRNFAGNSGFRASETGLAISRNDCSEIHNEKNVNNPVLPTIIWTMRDCIVVSTYESYLQVIYSIIVILR